MEFNLERFGNDPNVKLDFNSANKVFSITFLLDVKGHAEIFDVIRISNEDYPVDDTEGPSVYISTESYNDEPSDPDWAFEAIVDVDDGRLGRVMEAIDSVYRPFLSRKSRYEEISGKKLGFYER